MKYSLFFLFIQVIFGQSVWVRVDHGSALYLNPIEQEWTPINDKDKLPLRTYIITKAESQIRIFKETDVINIKDSCYFYIEDLFKQKKFELISSITKIDAIQLPDKKTKKKRKMGLIYGSEDKEQIETISIPYFKERKNAIAYFTNQKMYGSALLSQKRLMTRYPLLYRSIDNIKILFALFDINSLTELSKDYISHIEAVSENREEIRAFLEERKKTFRN